MADKIHAQEIEMRLKALKEWKYIAGEPDAIAKSFKFKDFKQAWTFMSKIAPIADTMDHHLEWSNVYNKVEIKLSTHDAGGVSEKDFKLAEEIDKI